MLQNCIQPDVIIANTKLALNTFALKIEGQTCDKFIDATIFFIADKDELIAYNEMHQEIFIYGNEEQFKSGRSLYYIASYIAECLSVNKSCSLIIHSAAVFLEKTGKSYLLLGEKGAGKTTLTIYLCKECGFKLIGNDQVRVINNNGILSTREGSCWFDVRKTALKASKYLGNIGIDVADKPRVTSWDNKAKILPGALGIETHCEETVLGGVFNIRIDPFQDEIISQYWSGIQQNLILHERLGRLVSAQTTPFQDDVGNYFGSLPLINTKINFAIRDEMVKAFIKNKVIELFGSNVELIVKTFLEAINASSRNSDIKRSRQYS
jgi:hypothetical protein